MALSPADKDAFIAMLNGAFGSIPSFLKDFIKPAMVLNYLQTIPANFRDYTLREIIDVIEEAKQNNKLKI